MVMSGLGLKVGQNSLIAKQTLIPFIIIETCGTKTNTKQILQDKTNTKH